MITCTGIFGRLFGHKYTARYHTIPPARRLESGPAKDIVAVNTANSQRIYAGDVCTRCGSTVNTKEAV